jgi:hypothetical protein
MNVHASPLAFGYGRKVWLTRIDYYYYASPLAFVRFLHLSFKSTCRQAYSSTISQHTIIQQSAHVQQQMSHCNCATSLSPSSSVLATALLDPANPAADTSQTMQLLHHNQACLLPQHSCLLLTELESASNPTPQTSQHSTANITSQHSTASSPPS